MTWNMEKNTVKVKVTASGNVSEYDFDGSRTLESAVSEIARNLELTAVNVLVNGDEVCQEDGKELLKDLDGDIEVVPKNTGANTRQ